ncbi:MAG: PAS domain S-box protein, partial [Myxococcales bacterium]
MDLGDFRQRLQQLHERRSNPPPEGAGSSSHQRALDELEAACEELNVADEELQVQQEQIDESHRQLEQERQRYRDLFDFAPEPYLVTDASGKIIQANGAAREMLGPHGLRLEGSFLVSFVSLRDRGQMRTRISQMAPGRETERWESTLATVPARAVALTLRSDAGGGLLWALRDITEQRRHQALLRSMNEELERRVLARTEELEMSRTVTEELFVRERQARKRSDEEVRNREELVALVSHELRNPMHAVLAWSQFSQDSTDSTELRQALEVIERNARTMAMLVDDLLERASMLREQRPLTLQPLRLRELLGRVCTSVEPLRRHASVELRFDPAGVELEVAGDAPRLEQVFLNLLGNALKFTPAGGTIEVALVAEDGLAVVSVSDSGPGIAADQLGLIFDHSHGDSSAARPGTRGLGLGLTVVKHLTEARGGSVEALSPGQGSTFVVRLPLAARPRSEAPQA